MLIAADAIAHQRPAQDGRMLRSLTVYTLIVWLATACAHVPTGILQTGTPAAPAGARHDDHGCRVPGSRAGDQFAGNDRRASKTSASAGTVEVYPSISALRAALPAERHMQGLKITRAPDSARAPEEDHNIRVRGLIYAMRRERDNDFHLIVGDNDCKASGCLINVEVSGLPADAASPYLSTLAAVRCKFLAFFDDNPPGTSGGYKKIDPAIHVALTGSLFFDVDHRAGVVGPAGLKPDSAWEVHPVTDIELER